MTCTRRPLNHARRRIGSASASHTPSDFRYLLLTETSWTGRRPLHTARDASGKKKKGRPTRRGEVKSSLGASLNGDPDSESQRRWESKTGSSFFWSRATAHTKTTFFGDGRRASARWWRRRRCGDARRLGRRNGNEASRRRRRLRPWRRHRRPMWSRSVLVVAIVPMAYIGHYWPIAVHLITEATHLAASTPICQWNRLLMAEYCGLFFRRQSITYTHTHT